MMQDKARLLLRLLLFCVMTGAISAYTVDVHKNLPEDSFLYMEFQGTNQMRWAADYLKAKAGGR